LDRTGDAYHIIPVSHRDVTGSLVSTSPLLDATISIGSQEIAGHAFHEKSPSGVRTARTDVAVVRGQRGRAEGL
jgi:hypothetical protein